jgi:hypothetical protein
MAEGMLMSFGRCCNFLLVFSLAGSTLAFAGSIGPSFAIGASGTCAAAPAPGRCIYNEGGSSATVLTFTGPPDTVPNLALGQQFTISGVDNPIFDGVFTLDVEAQYFPNFDGQGNAYERLEYSQTGINAFSGGGTLTVGVVRHPTSPLDYLFLPGFPGAKGWLPIAAGGPNVVTALPFHLDHFFLVGHVNLSIAVPECRSHAYVGLYDSTGALLLQGKFATDTAGNFTVTLTNPVALKPGMYYFAIGAEGTGAKAPGYLFGGGNLAFILGGRAANPIAGGSLPATLGTIAPHPCSTASAVLTP